MSKGDQNDLHKAGLLPDDPTADTVVASDDVPRVRTAQALLAGALERAMQPWDTRHVSTTGHYRLDDLTGGMRPGFCWLLGAATSWGKSSFATMLADDNLKQGRTVLIVSSEDAESVYADRLAQRRARVSANNLRHRRLSTEEHAALTSEVGRAERRPVYIDARGRSVEWLMPRLKQCIAEHKIDIVIFDYIGTFASKERQQDRRNSLLYIGRVLTDIVKQANVGGLILSQLTEVAADDRPSHANIRDCRDLAHAAEVVLIGWTPEEDVVSREGKKLARAGSRCIVVDKNKTGPRGALIELPWDERSACFESVTDPELEALAATNMFYDNEG